MLSTSLVALDATIIATAVPSIVRDLGGFSQFPWLFSIYLLTQAVTVPLYGKLADVVGRRPVLFFGIAVFLAGSVLCGVAWSMPALIIARAVQGIGAGAVLPMTITVVGDLYSVEERARVQGYVASVWGASSVIGPTLGGVFSEYLSWRWIFFVNIPLGGLAALDAVAQLPREGRAARHQIDVAGAVAADHRLLPGDPRPARGRSGLGLGSRRSATPSSSAPWRALVAFVLVERRAAEPVLPLWVFSHRVLVGGNLAARGHRRRRSSA